jgi:hypothetical protein
MWMTITLQITVPQVIAENDNDIGTFVGWGEPPPARETQKGKKESNHDAD